MCTALRWGDSSFSPSPLEHNVWERLLKPWQCGIKIHFEKRASLVMSTGFWLCSFLQTSLVMLSAHSLGLFVPGKQRANSPGYSNPFLTLCNYLEKCFDRRNEKLGHFRFRRKFLEHYVKQGLGVFLFMALCPKKRPPFQLWHLNLLAVHWTAPITKCRRHKTPEGPFQNGEGRENTKAFLHEHCWLGQVQ